MQDLTPTQKAILTAIRRAQESGLPPTVRELADQLEMKRSTVHYHMQALRRAGYLTAEGSHRATVLTGAAHAAVGSGNRKGSSKAARSATLEALALSDVEIPIVGSVAAGQPILAAEHITGSLSLGGAFDRKGTLFALVISGDSMIGDGIFEGDYAIVRQQSNATPGDVVVAMIDDGEASEATIKRYREDGDEVILEPSNPEYVPLRFKGHARDSLRILGKLVGLLRKI